MSYEGREAFICGNGHVFITDTHAIGVIEECYACKSPLTHVGSIDDTNCDATADFYFKKIKDEEKVNICPCCNKPESVIPASYKVIKTEEFGTFMFDHLKKVE